MKIIIISDVHGNYNNLKKVLDSNTSFDYMFILGDLLSSNFENNKKIASVLNPFFQKIICVRGNNDFCDFNLFDFKIDNDYALVPINHKLFFLTHGHMYKDYNTSQFEYDVFLSGHTHIASMKKDNNIYYLNPGSISLPRGNFKSYLIYENCVFSLINLDDNSIISTL